MDHGMHKKIFQSGRRGKAWSRFWQATAPKRKAALIIGLNFTDHMDLEPDQTHSRDVETMAKLLKSVYDFDSTVVLSDKEGTPEELIPTQSNIMRELATFIPSNPRSDYFFVFQGHSSRGVIEEIGTDEEYREAEYIIPSDGIDPHTNMVDLDRVITDQTLHNLLVADLPEDSQLIALFDSCNAGTLLDLQYPKSNRVQEDPNNPNYFKDTTGPRASPSTPFMPRRQYEFYGPMTINQVPHNHQGLDISSSPLLELDLLYPKDIHLQKEIHKGPGYRLHSGENKGKAVVVKVFEGRHAKKISVETANFNKQVMHPCFLQIIAAASGNSDLSFLVFSGDYRGTVESIMRVTLLQNLEKSFVLGLQTIVALSSGLDYLQDVNYPVLETEARAFVLLLTHLDNVVISFDPDVSNLRPRKRQIHLDAARLEAKWPERSKSILNLFSDILQKTFYLPCEEYYRLVQDPTPEERRSLTPLEPRDDQILASSTDNDPLRRRTSHDGRLSLERISHDTEAILKSFLLDPSLDRHHGRSTEALKELSGCCSRTLGQVSHCDCRWKDKPGCITKSTFSTLRKGCSSSSRHPDPSCQGEDTALREICCSPSDDATPSQEICSSSPSTEPSLVTLAASESSNPRGRTMIEGVAEFLRKDPSPKYRQIMQIAMTHVWMSERDNITPTLC